MPALVEAAQAGLEGGKVCSARATELRQGKGGKTGEWGQALCEVQANIFSTTAMQPWGTGLPYLVQTESSRLVLGCCRCLVVIWLDLRDEAAATERGCHEGGCQVAALGMH